MNSIHLGLLLVLPFWALMIFLPNWGITKRVIVVPFICLPVAIAYVWSMFPHIDEVIRLIMFPDMEGLTHFCSTPSGARVIWFHILLLDLFLARWIFIDSQVRRVRHGVLAAVLLLTLCSGPFGFLAYLVVRFGADIKAKRMFT